MSTCLEVDRSDPGRTRTVETDSAELGPGQVRLEVEFFALTANNVTYAVAGDLLGYWDFFPTDDPAWGRVPAMGWARVVESAHDGVAVGGRYYGWFPMASDHVITATPTGDGLRDDGDHRREHAPVYRALVSTDADPFHQPGDDAEARHALLRGLFLTGYLADSHLARRFPDADQTVVLSASSKTAIGYAACASDRGVAVVGVTSTGNVDFVGSLDCYSSVVSYDDVVAIDPARSTVVDMAGNGAALAAVHRHLGDDIAASLTIGKSHHDAAPATVEAGPAPEFFFAPTAIEQEVADKGSDGYRDDAAAALARFVDASHGWLTVDQRRGATAVAEAWAEVHAGAVGPDVGVIASQHD